MEKQEIVKFLINQGFEEAPGTSKVALYINDGVFIYIKRDTERLPIVIHPHYEFLLEQFSRIPGIILESDFKYYHNADMRWFPKRDNGGKYPIKYGIAVGVEHKMALTGLLRELLSDKEHCVFGDISDLLSSSIDKTEKENLIKARLGQGRFRELLLDDFEGVCAVSGVSLPEALRASHIKPWRLSSNKERLDPNNGLLLGVAYDALFDRYLISFSDDGKILISKSLPQDQLDKLGINRSAKLTSLNADRLKYLEHHRKEFSGRESKTLFV